MKILLTAASGQIQERDTRELFSIKIINTDEMYWLAFRRKINFFTVSEICIFESTQPAGS